MKLRIQKGTYLKALIALICSLQIMISTTLSSDQVIKSYNAISRNPLLLGLLLFFSCSVGMDAGGGMWYDPIA